MEQIHISSVDKPGLSVGTVVLRIKEGQLGLLPPDDAACQECGSIHEPDKHHQPDSLYWQITFSIEHDRYPTWKDAIEHCSPAYQAEARAKLAAMGIDVDAEYAASVAGAEFRKGQRERMATHE